MCLTPEGARIFFGDNDMFQKISQLFMIIAVPIMLKVPAWANPEWQSVKHLLDSLSKNRQIHSTLGKTQQKIILGQRVFIHHRYDQQGYIKRSRAVKQTLVLGQQGLEVVTKLKSPKGRERLCVRKVGLTPFPLDKKTPRLRFAEWGHLSTQTVKQAVSCWIDKHMPGHFHSQKIEAKDKGKALSSIVVDPLPAPLQDLVGKPDAVYYLARINDFKRRHPEKPVPAYYQFVYKNARRFTDETYFRLSPQGKKWIREVFVELQQKLEDARMNNPQTFAKWEQDGTLMELGYYSHVPAYMRTGFTRLPFGDLLQILTTPDVSDFCNRPAIISTLELGIKLHCDRLKQALED